MSEGLRKVAERSSGTGFYFFTEQSDIIGKVAEIIEAAHSFRNKAALGEVNDGKEADETKRALPALQAVISRTISIEETAATELVLKPIVGRNHSCVRCDLVAKTNEQEQRSVHLSSIKLGCVTVEGGAEAPGFDAIGDVRAGPPKAGLSRSEINDSALMQRQQPVQCHPTHGL